MRILFVEKQIDYEPLGLLYLSSVLRQAGHEVRLAVASDKDPLAVVREWQPAIVGYSVYTGAQGYYRDLNLRIKETANVVSVFGGPHPTYFPEYVEEPGVDAVCIGEAEDAILDLVETVESGRPLTGIKNWWFKCDGGVERNPVRPLENDMDRIAFIGTGMDAPMLSICVPYNEDDPQPGNGNMVAVTAPSKGKVDELYQKALSMGATCEGEPGQRVPDMFYGAYVRDPDGNKLAFYVFG